MLGVRVAAAARPAAAGSATCPSRSSRAPRPARRTRPPGRTASSGRSARAARRPPRAWRCGRPAAASGRSAAAAAPRAARPPRTSPAGSAPPGSGWPCRSLYAALILYICTRSLSFWCSSSQRRRSSSSRANRSARASWYVENRPPCTQAVLPGRARLERDDPAGRAVQQLAVVADQQHRLGRLAQPVLQPALAGDVEVVVRLVEQQHLVRPAQQRLQHQPLLLTAGQRAHLAPLRLLERDAERGHRADVPERLGVVAAGVRPVGERLGVRASGSARRPTPSSPARRRRAPRPPRGPAAGATVSSRSRTVEASRTWPTNWRITPSPPLRVTAPPCASRSPAMIRSSVVLPVPLGPISATVAPSPTRNETSSSSGRPSGRW